MEKTSKIKTVVSTKPYTGTNGTTLYHNLEMENGDKINIGKKKTQEVGWELTYEIIDSGQEYNKAKSVQKTEQQTTTSLNAPKNEGVQKMIVMQSSYATAMNYLIGCKASFNLEELDKTAKHIYTKVIEVGGTNGN